jgi:hypothetical protein
MKFVSCLLVASLCFFLGCYSTETVSKDDLNAQSGYGDLTVVTRDSLEYRFFEESYRVRQDTLCGVGVRRSGLSTTVVRDARLSFVDIASMETRAFNLRTTILVCGGIALGAGLIAVLLLQRGNQEIAVAPTGFVGK